MNKILIVEASQSDRRLILGLLVKHGYEPIAVDNMEAAKDEVVKLPPGAVVVAAMKFTGGTAQELINWQKREGYKFPVIAVMDNLNPLEIADVMKDGGAVNIIQRPAIDKQLVETVGKYARSENSVLVLADGLIPRKSKTFSDILETVKTIAATNANVIVFGESGTGKSATVKHLLTLPGMEELRLIEADKADLGGLPALIRKLDGRRQKFIVFIDDLTFDRDDPTYSVLKTILEGGVERRPQNVAVYATSNRRHLVRQTISERAGDEMDRSETIREKTSLADRFGVRVLFQGLGKGEYLALVDMLAGQNGVNLPLEELHRRAVAWERFHGAQTPRTALQFILSL